MQDNWKSQADETFVPGKDPTPEIKSCLMHPTKSVVNTFQRPGLRGFGGVTYGLCANCMLALREMPEYRFYIDQEIERRLDQLNAKKGEGNV